MQLENSTVRVLWEVEPHLPYRCHHAEPVACAWQQSIVEQELSLAKQLFPWNSDSKAAGTESETMDNFSYWWQGQ